MTAAGFRRKQLEKTVVTKMYIAVAHKFKNECSDADESFKYIDIYNSKCV